MTKGNEAAKGKLTANERGRANLKPDVRTRKHNDLGPAGRGMDLEHLTSTAMAQEGSKPDSWNGYNLCAPRNIEIVCYTPTYWGKETQFMTI